MDRDTRIYYSPDFLRHGENTTHPECPGRIESIKKALMASPIYDRLEFVEPPLACDEDILGVHKREYLDMLKGLGEKPHSLDLDTYYGKGTLKAALRAAGSGVAAVDEALKGRRFSFSMCRPPGHHARPSDGAMGFCIFNNAAIAAQHAIENGLRRVMIVDFDYHHGNGTEETFYERDDVYYFSTHSEGYPGTGAAEKRGRGKGRGFNLNYPMPWRTEDERFIKAYETVMAPVMREYKPELVIVSAGYDCHYDDPVGGMKVTETGFRVVSSTIAGAAEEVGAPVVALLEGGYSLAHLGTCVEASLLGFMPGVRNRLNRQ